MIRACLTRPLGSAPLLSFAVALLVLLGSTGCSRFFRRTPASVQISSLQVVTNATGQRVHLDVMQNLVQRFADNYAAVVAQAVDDMEIKEKNPKVRIEALRWKLSQATAAFVDASGPNPGLNSLDLVVLASVSRMVMEDEIATYFGTNGAALLATHKKLEADSWEAANRLLGPKQRDQLATMIAEWRRKHPNQRYVGTTRFRELAAAVANSQQPAVAGPSSIFGLLFLDPLAGLDPTAAAIEQTKEMAERAMYYAQRMPILLSWQAQLLSLQMAAEPEVQELMVDVDSFAKTSERLAKVAEQLPQLVNDQREAAIKQILDGVAAERTNLLAGLAAEEQKARALMVEARDTLNAGTELAASVTLSIKQLDEFVRYVSPTNETPAPVNTNTHPFNVLDYGTAAGQVGGAAKDLNSLLSTVNASAPQLAQLRKNTAEDATRLVHRMFWLGLALIVILLAGAVCAALIYHSIVARKKRAEVAQRPTIPERSH